MAQHVPSRVQSRLADRLEATRHGRFVGRAMERALFESALQPISHPREAPFSVLHIYGPGGIGKTTLLREFALLCRAHDTRAVFLDARELEPSPAAFEGALSLALETRRAPLDFLSAQKQRHAFFIDTYERLAPLDNWLRETFLPQLPDDHLVVLAGRNPPRASWKLDSGWSSLLRALPLRNLSPQESLRFLSARQVPATQHDRVLDFTHGHPLALSLVADAFDQGGIERRRDTLFQPQDAPDVVQLLVAHLVEEIPTAAHRAALEACALVRWTTEPLLAHLLQLDAKNDESAQLFEWLHSLSFIESGAQGLRAHDMAREALAANLRWRNPQSYTDYHRRARVFYAAQLQGASETEQQKTLADYIFLHHDNAMIRPFLEWQENGDLVSTAAREDDLPILREMVQRHEGRGIGAAFRVLVCATTRKHSGSARQQRANRRISLLFGAAPRHPIEERESDPATRAAWHFLRRSAPLRRGEGATMFRFWMARDAYQSVSTAQSLIFVNIVRHYLTTPNLALTFLLVADADFWAPIFAYAHSTRYQEADFQTDATRFGVYGHDWRLTPPLAWLDKLAENETSASAADSSVSENKSGQSSTRSSTDGACSVAPVLLSEEEFAFAVREALKNLARPAILSSNPLLRSRALMVRFADASASSSSEISTSEPLLTSQKIAVLQNVLRMACETLRATERTEKWYQALRLRYLEPAATQESAAEKMDVPFSTFRRYLKSGLERVVEELWRQEIGDDLAA